jgi:hypothetical protein
MTLMVSSDEGKSWSIATDIPDGKAAMFIPHPFDNHYVSNIMFYWRMKLRTSILTLSPIQAFVLTRGTMHYHTKDRGEIWRAFDVPGPTSFSKPLSFIRIRRNMVIYSIKQGFAVKVDGRRFVMARWATIPIDSPKLYC